MSIDDLSTQSRQVNQDCQVLSFSQQQPRVIFQAGRADFKSAARVQSERHQEVCARVAFRATVGPTRRITEQVIGDVVEEFLARFATLRRSAFARAL